VAFTKNGLHGNDIAEQVSADRPGWKWLLEPQLALLMLVVIGIYFTRLTVPNLRGEEPRRARVAVEMIESGDWIVPRQQGQLFFSRPPLQNWFIALLGLARGHVDEVAVRLPSALATLLTALLVYGYARGFLSSLGALVSGLAFATMGQVMELGRLGETESIFTLVVGGSLLVWHWGYTRGWPRVCTWSCAYFLAALGMLAKGPQGPIYFGAVVGVYLVITRRWRELVSWPHLVGILIFTAVWSAWQVPYLLQEGLAATKRMYGNDVAMRFEDTSWATIIGHLAVYPAEILVCLLPWSALLAVYFQPSFWRSLGKHKSNVLFLLCCIAVTFPTCWLVPGAKSRYFMPLYPCFAVLVGLAAQQCWHCAVSASWRNAWRNYVLAIAGVMVLAGVAVPLLGVIPGTEQFAQPVQFAIPFTVLSLTLAAIAWWSADASTAVKSRVGALSVAAFLGLAYMGLATNLLVARSDDTEQQVAELKRKLPADARLVSVGLADTLFTYYYEKPIEPLDQSELKQHWPADASYFCFTPFANGPPELDFRWEEIAVITCDRHRRQAAERTVVVARRLDSYVAETVSTRRK
jgi:4-amino-4-deoxy-L-arabinose transferase-like glycosyltransferase